MVVPENNKIKIPIIADDKITDSTETDTTINLLVEETQIAQSCPKRR